MTTEEKAAAWDALQARLAEARPTYRNGDGSCIWCGSPCGPDCIRNLVDSEREAAAAREIVLEQRIAELGREVSALKEKSHVG
jgi:hypothetical protein